MSQSLKGASLTTKRLSPLAKPFILNCSDHQLSSNFSVVSGKEPSIQSFDDCNDDPFSFLLDSFRQRHHYSNAKGDSAVSVPLSDDYRFGQQNPSVNNEENVGSSVADKSLLQKVSDGVFKISTGSTSVLKDVLSSSSGTNQTDIESSSILMSKCEVSPPMLSTLPSTANLHVNPQAQNQSSKNLLGDSDSDVDSPCWKGTMAFCQSLPEISRSDKSEHVEKAPEKHNNLNPLAPPFFPSIGYVKDDSVSSKSSAHVTIDLLTGDDILNETYKAESHPVELNKGIELQCSSNIHVREKAFDMLNDPKSSFVDPVVNSHCMITQSSSVEDCLTSKENLLTIVVDGSVKGAKDPSASRLISGSFSAKAHSPIPTSTASESASQVSVVTDLFYTLKDVLKSLIESPEPYVQKMVSAMHVLSELLIRTCAKGLDSDNEHDHDMIRKIVNNLNVFISRKCGRRIPTLDSTHTDSPYCLDRSTKLPEGFEVKSKKTLPVPLPHQIFYQNDSMRKNIISKVVAESGQRWSSFASSHNEGTGKGNEVVELEIIRRSIEKSLDFERQMQPDALLFKNLWLDAVAEQCFTKYKTYFCLMKAGTDLNCTNVAVFPPASNLLFLNTGLYIAFCPSKNLALLLLAPLNSYCCNLHTNMGDALFMDFLFQEFWR